MPLILSRVSRLFCTAIAIVGTAIGTAVGTIGWNPSAHAVESLTIGSEAPKIDIEHWVQTGGGKYPKVTKFATGRIYVVEFWATWCPPCVASMPHLAELQTKLDDKKVQIISISDEPLDTVKEFLQKPTPDDRSKSYFDVTKDYCLTTDPDRSCYEAYMDAARQGGIPCAFLVGKDSKIEWIGHPMEIDPVIEAVVDGTWDREAFGKAFREQQEEEELLERLGNKISGLERKKQYAAAIETIDMSLLTVKSMTLRYVLNKKKLELRIKDKAEEGAIVETIKGLYKIGKGDFEMLVDTARTAFQLYKTKVIKSKTILEFSIAQLKELETATADADDEQKMAVLDTVAHLQFAAGDLAGALVSERKSLDVADDETKESIRKFIAEIETAMAKASSTPEPTKQP